MNEKIVEIDLNRLKEEYIFGKVARHANGAVMYKQNKTVIIATAVLDEKPVDEPFLPLTVQYIEKAYAAAKIPGGYLKRESKPSDFETLTSRLIDRSLRPLFPDGFYYPVTITVMVVSADKNTDLQLASLHAANAALMVSDIPVERSIAGVRVGKIDGEYILNPDREVMESSSLDLFVTGSGDDILMIEMAAKATEVIDSVDLDEIEIDPIMAPIPMVLEHQESNEMSEEELLKAIEFASSAISKASSEYQEKITPLAKDKLTLPLDLTSASDEAIAFVKENFLDDIKASLHSLSKSERGGMLKEISKEAFIKAEELASGFDEEEIKKAVEAVKRAEVRRQILQDRVRADGRRLDEVRPISIETNILPSVHGSCLFTRGETQVLATATIGDSKDAQMFEMLSDRGPKNEKFMVHYNFPGFSVGEAKPIGAPGRRELGHGNLAKRALEPVIDMNMDNAIRLVSEVLESNGSSSMATVCGGSLALVSAQIETKALVAGVAMGLITEGDDYAILTDIMGLEDHDGDMDFKVAGTHKGITAMQMDIKLGGLDMKILSEALMQAKDAREHILSIMERAKENIKPSGALPTVEHFSVEPSKIVHIIGKAGSTIRDIIERFEVAIDLDRDKGHVKLSGHDKDKVQAAKEHIESIVNIATSKEQIKYEVGKTYKGKIKRLVDFGAFVELPGGIDALLHISKVAKGRVDDIHDIYKEGDEIDVVVMEQKGHKIELATPEYLGR